MDAIEVYFYLNPASKSFQIHVSDMKLSILRSDGVIELENIFKGYKNTRLNDVVTSTRGKKYENRYRVIGPYHHLRDIWSYLANEIRVDITVSKITCNVICNPAFIHRVIGCYN